MQLASNGGRALTKGARHNASNFIPRHNPHQGLGSVRSIHVPPIRPPTTQAVSQIQGTAQKFFSFSRNVVSKFVTQLTAPGLIHAAGSSASHGVAGAATNPSLLARRAVHTSGIQSGLSFPTRVTLSRPIRPFALPKGPGLVPCRSTTQVGLGVARNFSSSRPLFQNLVENVPIAGRAFYEADWDTKMRKEKENHFGKLKADKKKKAKRGEMAKPKQSEIKKAILADKVETESQVNEEMDMYFAPVKTQDIITTLLVPLAPTPTSRAPLPEYPTSSSGHPSLLPRAALWDIHNQHSTHTLRVSSLFARLDGAAVWDKGVRCSAYAHGAIGDFTPDAINGDVCTVLKVEFVGWRKDEVRGVIGECGTGWCVLEEEDTSRRCSSGLSPIQEEDDDLSSLSGDEEESSVSSETMDHSAISQSFVMPTLDFSSSFLSQAPTAEVEISSPSSLSPSTHHSTMMSTPTFVDPPTENGYFDVHPSTFRFSSHFAERVDSEWERLSDWESSSSQY